MAALSLKGKTSPVVLVSNPFHPTVRRLLGSAAQLPVVSGVATLQLLFLGWSQPDVADPTTHRRRGDADPTRDLLNRRALVTSDESS
jgi:hypothetical protein